MKIWVDADACPKPIKEILIRAANRCHIPMTFVANQRLNLPPSVYIKALCVPSGFNVADERIIAEANKDDLIITADIPLADAVITKGCIALNPRGWLYTQENIKQRLDLRNFMEDLRGAGVSIGGPKTLHPKDLQAFANHLDTIITRSKKY